MESQTQIKTENEPEASHPFTHVNSLVEMMEQNAVENKQQEREVITVTSGTSIQEVAKDINMNENTNEESKVSQTVGALDAISFTNCLITFFTGSDNPHDKPSPALYTQVKTVEEIHKKLQQDEPVSIHEMILYENSRSFAILSSYLQKYLHRLDSLMLTHTIVQDTEREQLLKGFTEMWFNELVWFTKLYVKTLIKKNQSILKDITWDNDQRNHPSYVKKFNSRNFLLLDPTWESAKPVQECWNKFWISLFPTLYRNVISTNYWYCIQNLQYSLSQQWQQAIEYNKWQAYFEGILNLSDAHNKYLLKSIMVDEFGRASMAMPVLIRLIMLLYADAIKINAESKFWSLQIGWIIIKVIYGVWPGFIRHWLGIRKQKHKTWMNSNVQHGMRLIYYGWLSVFGINHLSQFDNVTDYVNSILPWDSLGLRSRIDTIPEPKPFQHSQILNGLFNKNNDPDHYINKHSTLLQIMMTVLFCKHHDILQKLYGQAKFRNNASFGSTVLNSGNFEKSFGVLFESLDKRSIQVSKNDEQIIQTTLSNLHTITLDMTGNPPLPALTQYSRVYMDEYNTNPSSDDTVHEENEMEDQSLSGSDDVSESDSCSTADPIPKPKNIVSALHPLALEKKFRKTFTRKMKLILWGLKQKAHEWTSSILYENWCLHKLRIKNYEVRMQPLMDKLIEKIKCSYIGLSAMYGDECINHIEHITTMMQKYPNASWTTVEYRKLITKKWAKASRKNKKNMISNLNNLVFNKYNYTIDAVKNARLLHVIWEWVMKELKPEEHKLAILEETASEQMISEPLLILMIEMAIMWYNVHLCSIDDAHKKREWKLSDAIVKWLHKSYANKNELPYKLLMNKTGKFDEYFANGIPDEADTHIKTKTLFDDEKDCVRFLYHFDCLLLKFIIWYPQISVAASGDFEWNYETYHAALQDCKRTIENLIYAQYYWLVYKDDTEQDILPMGKTEFEQINGTDPTRYKSPAPEHDYVYATDEEKQKAKVNQCVCKWIHNLANDEVPCTDIFDHVVQSHIVNNLLTLPTSTALKMVSPSNWRGPSCHLNALKWRGMTNALKNKAISTQLMNNKTRCCDDVMKYHQLTEDQHEDETREIINDTLAIIPNHWQEAKDFGTGAHDTFVDQKFWKHNEVILANPWNVNKKPMPEQDRLRDWTHGTKFYGKQWHAFSGKDHVLLNSIEYKTVTHLMQKEEFSVHDLGPRIKFQDWYVQDTESDDEEITDQPKSQIPMYSLKGAIEVSDSDDQDMIEYPNVPKSVVTKSKICKGFSDDDDDDEDDDDDNVYNYDLHDIQDFDLTTSHVQFGKTKNKTNIDKCRGQNCNDLTCYCHTGYKSSKNRISASKDKVSNFNSDKFAKVTNSQWGYAITSNVISKSNSSKKKKAMSSLSGLIQVQTSQAKHNSRKKTKAKAKKKSKKTNANGTKTKPNPKPKPKLKAKGNKKRKESNQSGHPPKKKIKT